jgi:hypothetical protein
MSIAFCAARSRRSPGAVPVKFEMVVNLKTAKPLGLAVPPSMLRATEVVEWRRLFGALPLRSAIGP